ncbi:MAG: cytochrome c family protein [Acidobacteriia bacterium]|nr:cytochrome c family protein [Terriglobia bacterium]
MHRPCAMNRMRKHGTALLPWLGLMALLAVFVPSRVTGSYVGAGRCRPCHLQQAESWKTTKMANAFDLLKPGARTAEKKSVGLDPQKDYTHDSLCLSCHTTGYNQPGGFKTIESTPQLAGVQCEMCHGAGDAYLKPSLMSLQNKEFKRETVMAAGLVIPNTGTCLNCHNDKSPFAKKSGHFNFEQRKAQGTHQHLALKYRH